MCNSLHRILRLLPAVLLLTASAGCIPNASWLPDSSGFVCAGGEKFEKLIFYDVAKGKARVLAEKGIDSAPTVSPDGKRIAAVHILEDDNKSLQVVIYDLDGKESHRSKPLKRPEGSDGRPGAFWVPGQDRLLVGDSRSMGFYDLKTGQFSMHYTWGSLVSIVGGSPIRPDGKGFLAVNLELKPGVKGGKQEESLLFVDWDGKETKIDLPTPDEAHKNSVYWPTPLQWDGDVAVIRASDDRITIDAKKLTVAVETVTPELSADKKWIHDQLRLAGGAVVRLVELNPAHPAKETKPDDPKPLMRIEVQKPDEKEAKMIVDDAEYAVIDPSPDGKMAVVQARNFSKTTGWVFLIDAKGDVAAKIDAYKTP